VLQPLDRLVSFPQIAAQLQRIRWRAAGQTVIPRITTMSKVIVITGASGGLGMSLAIAGAKAGHRVFATMRDTAKCEAVNRAAATADVGVEVLALDVGDAASVDAAVASVMAQQGRIDVLINNAGAGFARATEQASLEDIAWIMDVNFMGAVRTTKAVLPHMRAARSGHIVNISSVGGLVGQPFNEIYCASKFALEGYTEALASYVQPRFNVRFTAVEPGGMHSDFAGAAMKHVAATGGLLQDDYLPILQAYMARAKERGTSAYQTADEVAAIVMACIESSDPPIRLRTSPWAEALCELKTRADPDGKALQRQVIETFLGR
jgi:NAD(P)-dependent dehydrogenase (short-subunit alcohol dehydrogenase family)